MNLRVVLLSTLLLATVVAAQPDYTPDPSWKPPAAEAARPNPLKPEPRIVAGGAKLFRRNCEECHGADGMAGKRGAAPLQSPAVRAESDGTLFWKISDGHVSKGMPSFSGLPELQRWQLVLYIRSLQQGK